MSEVSKGAVRAAFAKMYPGAVYQENPDAVYVIRRGIQAAKDHDADWQDPATIPATYDLVKEIYDRLISGTIAVVKESPFPEVRKEQEDARTEPADYEVPFLPDGELDLDRLLQDPPWLTNGLMSPQDEVNAARSWWSNQQKAKS